MIFKKIKKILLMFLVIIVFLGAFQWYNNMQSKCRKSSYTYEDNSLPKEFNGFKIGYLSDLNLVNKDDLTKLEKAVKDINEQEVDMILFGGDIYNSNSFEIDKVSSILRKLKSSYGKFALLGEKDQSESTNCNNLLTEAGFEVLHNELRTIYYNDASIQLIGLENNGDCSGVINDTNKDTYKIAFVHQPDFFKEVSNHEVNLQLSGHTLGGYLRIPFIGGIITKDKGSEYVSGKHTLNNTTLYISNGFNKEATQNYRFLTHDEFNIITLKR